MYVLRRREISFYAEEMWELYFPMDQARGVLDQYFGIGEPLRVGNPDPV